GVRVLQAERAVESGRLRGRNRERLGVGRAVAGSLVETSRSAGEEGGDRGESEAADGLRLHSGGSWMRYDSGATVGGSTRHPHRSVARRLYCGGTQRHFG